MNKVEVLERATIIVNSQGLIEDIYEENNTEAAQKYSSAKFEQDVDCKGKSVLPGFVDAHTHPVWSGDRVHEFAMKLAGATYMEVHKAGGGIGFTVRHTRESSEEELLALLLERLRRMLSHGTTVVEAKSGYGLDLENEMKMLKVLHQAKQQSSIEIISTYLGAHSVPKDKSLQDYTKEILDVHIPKIKELKAKGEISPCNIDVFHEKGVFETEETRAILKAGRDIGLQINFHGDELHAVGSAELSGDLDVLAISHLEHISDAGISAMAKRPTFAVLLPTTAYILRLVPPPARKMIEGNVPVALGSDYNPNAHCVSMPFVMNLACVNMRMSMNEALVAATINSAAALGISDSHGSIEVGKRGDFVLLSAPKWEHVIYQLVDPPISSVFKGGKPVWSSSK
eukprot:TRINITY_DN7390_c0_g1_i1.p1 TRINITY_DN7390_c0_g1~~TRINITY_DN7390_c0_g1_i1.p1  ORF type:complete len:437 (-),score=87.41 TRINITY_DN7390_c0_g1_i1:58-1254(-)